MHILKITPNSIRNTLKNYIYGPQRIILIGGCGRSGTSLLSAIMGAHPLITTIEFETGAFRNIEQNASFLNRQYQIFRLAYFKARQDGSNIKPILCEKTPRNIYFTNKAREVYSGKVKFLFLIRNGLDTMTSIHPGQKEYYISIDRWINDTKRVLFHSEDPDVLLVPYEGLITNLKGSMIRVSDFLEIPFSETLLNYQSHTNVNKHGAFHGGSIKKIYPSATNKWRDPIHSKRIREISEDNSASSLIPIVSDLINDLVEEINNIPI